MRLCIYVFMYLCVDVFVYLWKTINVYLCFYGIVALWICVNPLSSLSVPFVIYLYAYIHVTFRSHGSYGQQAIASYRTRLCNRTMWHERVEAACAVCHTASLHVLVFRIIKTQDALLAVPASGRHVNEFQDARSLQSCRQSITRVFDQRRWGRVICQRHVLHLASLQVEP